MKQLTIGRDEICDIVIVDNSNVVSRRHAILDIYSNGKMTITDVSGNGTYVNGLRITSNTPVPVTKNDTISFAHVTQLDWSKVSNPNIVLKNILLGAGGILILICICYGVYKFAQKNPDPENGTVVVDSTMVEKEQPKEKQEDTKEAKESAQPEAVDSAKAKKDSTEQKNDEKSVKRKPAPVKGKEQPTEKKDSTANTPVRIIG